MNHLPQQTIATLGRGDLEGFFNAITGKKPEILLPEAQGAIVKDRLLIVQSSIPPQKDSVVYIYRSSVNGISPRFLMAVKYWDIDPQEALFRAAQEARQEFNPRSQKELPTYL
ncbi:MAG TPA: hypothetical protein VJB12_02520 [Candidatus Nanoarchaeia archaeon]|nr:hypothetical protein [Candidatus Nanoarchaeia archaeon]